jgi:glycine cleavage system H protein
MAWKSPENLKYTKSDEWILIEGDSATVGITDYAQDQLNDIVFVELPEIGEQVTKEGRCGTVESVKAASDLFSPVAGSITAVNEALEDQPELLNSDPYGKGWIVKLNVTDSSGIADLMNAAAYAKYCESR